MTSNQVKIQQKSHQHQQQMMMVLNEGSVSNDVNQHYQTIEIEEETEGTHDSIDKSKEQFYSLNGQQLQEFFNLPENKLKQIDSQKSYQDLGALNSRASSGVSDQQKKEYQTLRFNRMQASIRGQTEQELDSDPKFNMARFFVSKYIQGDTSLPVLPDKKVYDPSKFVNKQQQQNNHYHQPRGLNSKTSSSGQLLMSSVEDPIREKQLEQRIIQMAHERRRDQEKSDKRYQFIGSTDTITAIEREVIRAKVKRGLDSTTQGNMVSSLKGLHKHIVLIPDGCNVATTKAIRVDICRYLEKYDFDTQKPLDRWQVSGLELGQNHFEQRSFLELLNTAVYALNADVYSMDRRLFKYMFMLDGTPIRCLREIPVDSHVLIVSEERQFQGIWSDRNAINKNDLRILRDLRGKADCLRQTQSWHKDQLLSQWIQADSKLISNKVDQQSLVIQKGPLVSNGDVNEIPQDNVYITQGPQEFRTTAARMTLESSITDSSIYDKQQQLLLKQSNMSFDKAMQNFSHRQWDMVYQSQDYFDNAKPRVDAHTFQKRQRSYQHMKMKEPLQKLGIKLQNEQDRKKLLEERARPSSQVQFTPYDSQNLDSYDETSSFNASQSQLNKFAKTNLKFETKSKTLNQTGNTLSKSHSQIRYASKFTPSVQRFFKGMSKEEFSRIKVNKLKGGMSSHYTGEWNKSEHSTQHTSPVKNNSLALIQKKDTENQIALPQKQGEQKDEKKVISLAQQAMERDRKQDEVRGTQFSLVKRWVAELNLPMAVVFQLLSEYKSLLQLQYVAPMEKRKMKQNGLYQMLTRKFPKNNDSDDDESNDYIQAEESTEEGPSLDSPTAKEVMGGKKKDDIENVLVCGDLAPLISIFDPSQSTIAKLDDNSLTVEEKKKRKGGHLAKKHLLSVRTYLDTEIFSKLIDGKVLDRILRAFQIETTSDGKLNQYQFLALNAFLKFHSLQLDQLNVLWTRIFDPIGLGRIPQDSYLDLIGRLSRGKATEPTIASSLFEKKMLDAIKGKGIINQETGEMIVEKLSHALKTGDVDVNIFNGMISSGGSEEEH